MKNRKTKQCTYSLGKMREFDPDAVCFVLGWDMEDVEIENDHETYEIHGFNKQTGEHDPDQAWERIEDVPWDNTFRYVFNYSKKKYIDMEKYQYITDENKDLILSSLNWNNDKVVFRTEASYGYHNLSDEEFIDFFYSSKYGYKKVELSYKPQYTDDGLNHVTFC